MLAETLAQGQRRSSTSKYLSSLQGPTHVKAPARRPEQRFRRESPKQSDYQIHSGHDPTCRQDPESRCLFKIP